MRLAVWRKDGDGWFEWWWTNREDQALEEAIELVAAGHECEVRRGVVVEKDHEALLVELTWRLMRS